MFGEEAKQFTTAEIMRGACACFSRASKSVLPSKWLVSLNPLNGDYNHGFGGVSDQVLEPLTKYDAPSSSPA